MATTKDVQNSGSPLDTALLALAALLILASLVAYYYFEATPLVVRVLGILVAIAGAAALVYSTQLGKFLWQFIQGSRTEIRKVVWPTRQETTNTTITVFVFLLVLGIFFWGLDWILLIVTRSITGQGS